MTDSLRALKFLVIAMGVVIIIGTAVVVVTIFQRASTGWGGDQPVGPAIEVVASDAAPSSGFGTRTLDVPRSSRIVDMAAEGDRLFIHLETSGGGHRIVVLDTATGVRLGAFDIREAP